MNKLCSYDFTIWESPKDGETVTAAEVRTFMTKYGKHWSFQLESCPETTTRHFQCRISLKVGERLTTFLPKWHAYGFTGNVSVTSNDCAKLPNAEWYCMKDDSRVDGPWKSTDEGPPFIPYQVDNERMPELWPWQQAVVDSHAVLDTRAIHFVYDEDGAFGKSSFCIYMGARRKAVYVPPIGGFKEILRYVHGRVLRAPEERHLFLIDLPRGFRGGSEDFWSAIETAKSGFLYDDRYTGRELFIHSPTIWVFANCVPVVSLISKDKWRFYRANKNENRLDKMSVPDVAALGQALKAMREEKQAGCKRQKMEEEAAEVMDNDE